MDRQQLADFLRSRREALQPEDVGLGRGGRRRTAGLRREEVAALSDMSADYYSRLEQRRGPRPSTSMLASMARGLRLSLEERDYLFRLAGYAAPPRAVSTDHIGPGLMRIFDRLTDTPAEIVNALGETLAQTPAGIALVGDLARYTGLQRSIGYRWFTDPNSRARYPVEDHEPLSRGFTSALRSAYTNPATRDRATTYLDALLGVNAEFTELWERHEIIAARDHHKRIIHPELGLIELQCQVLIDPDQGHSLLVYTATPGTPSHSNLALLTVVGGQAL
jgi:transcriptional regulator with XRE-family HTH domain